jgi:chromosome segregation ATPase
MGLLDGIEKLINEHGSAKILKERIGLANDKYSALESKYAEAEQKIKSLESESQKLKQDNDNLNSEIETLRSQLSERRDNRLKEQEEEILIFVASNPNCTDNQIATNTGMGVEVAAFYIQEMEDKNLIYGSYAFNSDPRYSLDQGGRGYLIKRGLIK